MPGLGSLAERAGDQDSSPNIVRARISRVPADLDDELAAIVPSFDEHRLFEIRFWSPRVDAAGDAVLPSVDDDALVAFDDNGEPWLIAWQPS